MKPTLFGYTADELRTAAAILAATLGVFICTAQHHFNVLPLHPRTYAPFLQHRCGECLLAAVLWMVLETLNLLTPLARSPAHLGPGWTNIRAAFQRPPL